MEVRKTLQATGAVGIPIHLNPSLTCLRSSAVPRFRSLLVPYPGGKAGDAATKSQEISTTRQTRR
jgi:hypothetical protein